MPTARESLLDAALAALGARPWAAVRMVDVALAAGVSRQTLYNEFSSKQGLARALARREADEFLAGVENALAEAERRGADAGECFAAATAWTLHAARRSPLVHATLTGCRSERLPAAAGRIPAQRSPRTPAALSAAVPAAAGRTAPSPATAADAVLSPAELVVEIRDRAVGALEHGCPKLNLADIGWACEAAVRLTLAYVVAPASSDEDACRQVARLVRGLLARGF
ncbi:TetR family transcriptional regulator [Streptomyces sp. H10-C2]|uniref:TetR/AcrR family transcriptional regulator n=1 Tax=Streptomyces sp. PH10-H1 TaxID=3046212 RepID=UPI0024BB1CDE|nr:MULTISPECIES: TetR family transcriptional regulator [unclassified Streptomyces]MDJ0343230.1 TetR family transcriptional regulator [Streptomyces sp. PH10-H1]MDJ0370637.1 TetR family transcriptional regulator [Streptomyces sp. H10-C2]